MRKRIVIIVVIAVIVCTLAASSMLKGYSAETKDAHDGMAAQVELDGLMAQVKTGVLDLDAMSDEEYMTIAHTVCELVDRSGMVTEAAHYFRNCFARAPSTLDEMMAVIRHEQGGTFGWKLVSRKGTWLHMFGRNGEYNMKFISADGHFEVIYNIDGVKLTEENDSMNMGTFNYADSVNEKLRHTIYDVLPFFAWGNSREAVKQVNGLSDDLRPIDKNDGAVKRFEKYRELLYEEKTQEMSGNGRDQSNIMFMLCFCAALLALSRASHALTGDKYIHAALPLDADLAYMFSFGRRRARNPFIGYFKRERLDRGIHTSSSRLCRSMITFVSTEPP